MVDAPPLAAGLLVATAERERVEWELELEPGASTTLSYVSSFYIR